MDTTIEPSKPPMAPVIRKPYKSANLVFRERRSNLDKLAIWITDKVGTMGFFLIIFLWTVTWLGWNTVMPVSMRFDPYPGFVLWLFLSNVIQIFLMPLIMVGQTLQGKYSDARAEADYEINARAENEIAAILLHLEEQNKLILQILKHLDDQRN